MDSCREDASAPLRLPVWISKRLDTRVIVKSTTAHTRMVTKIR